MNYQEIIKQIKIQKQLPNLRFRIKEKAEAFTQNLFYTLFDQDTPVEENLEKLAIDFKELGDLVCWEPGKPCSEMGRVLWKIARAS